MSKKKCNHVIGYYDDCYEVIFVYKDDDEDMKEQLKDIGRYFKYCPYCGKAIKQ